MPTVLIVDDDPRIRKLLCRTLEKQGIGVIEAQDGDAGVTRFREASPDAVVMDIIMPGMDGLTAIREIKRTNRQAKVIAMSGGLVMTPDAYLDEAHAAGADRVMAKPIDRQQFLDAVLELLEP